MAGMCAAFVMEFGGECKGTREQCAMDIRQRGQGLIEYALVILLIAIVLIFLLTFIGARLNNTFSQVGSGLGP